MWWNELHPSEQTDRIIAEEFVNAVSGQSNWTTYWSDEAKDERRSARGL